MTHRAVALSAIALIAACGSPKIVKTLCREDTDCEGGLLCEDFRCVEQKTKACEVVTDGNPILQPSPYTVAMGDLDVAESEQIVELHSIGNCTLTLFEASLVSPPDAGTGFDCSEFCGGKFPVEIFPNRNVPVHIKFKAKGVGRADDELKILSDDREFPELRVPLHANFIGVPSLKATPNPVDFGYVTLNATRTVTLTNQGTGVATIEVKAINLDPVDTMDFGLDLGDLTFPFTLAPISKDNTALKSLKVSYHPRSAAIHMAKLVISTNKGDMAVPLNGNSMTPPKIVVSPMMIDFGNVPYGATNVLPLTMQNEGGAPLIVTYMWTGTLNTDFFAVPATLPQIMGGTYTELQIGFTNTTGSGVDVTGFLLLSTNDPGKASVPVTLRAHPLPPAGPEVVKIEMSFDNGNDGLFDKDVRNVDLRLEHPYGFVCDKAHPMPTTWGMYGSPAWLAFPPKEEPERIILTGAMVDATYKVQLSYMEDCKSIPTDLLAGLLGISVDALVDYLSGGLIPLDPQMVSNIISNICLDHSSSNATVTVYVNGQIRGQKTVGLGHKGDNIYAMDLVRDGGSFEVH